MVTKTAPYSRVLFTAKPDPRNSVVAQKLVDGFKRFRDPDDITLDDVRKAAQHAQVDSGIVFSELEIRAMYMSATGKPINMDVNQDPNTPEGIDDPDNPSSA